MKKLGSLFFLLLITFLFSNHALADKSGTIKVKAEFVAPSCKLSIKNTKIDLGEHVVTELGFRDFNVNQNTSAYNYSYKSTNYANLNVTNCYVTTRRFYIKFSGPRAILEQYKDNTPNYRESFATPFVDSNVGGVGVYLFVEGAAKLFDGKANTKGWFLLNGTDNEEFDVKVDGSKGTGSLTAHFWLYATRTTSVDVGTLNIPVVATLYMQ